LRRDERDTTPTRIALPEKALLDWICSSREEGLPTPVDEINIQFLNHRKLREFAECFRGSSRRSSIKWFLITQSLNEGAQGSCRRSDLKDRVGWVLISKLPLIRLLL
jgi:hypothetical protein